MYDFGNKQFSKPKDGFQKSKHFITCWLKAFLSDIPQSIKRENKGPEEKDEKLKTKN